MMNRFLLSFLLCAVTLWSDCAVSTPEPQVLTLTPRIEVSPPVVDFTPDITAWLRSHPVIKVGVWGLSQPPVSEGIERGQLAGIDADYLSLLESALDVHFTLIHYRNSRAALAALSSGEITLLAVWNKAMTPQGKVQASLPWLLDSPVLVSRQKNVALTAGLSNAPPHLLNDLLTDAANLTGRTPLEENSGQQNYHHIINSVALGTAEPQWMNRATAKFLTRDMQVEHLWLLPHPTHGDLNLSFGVSERSPHLLRAIDSVLSRLPLVSRLRIAQSWGLGNDHVVNPHALQLSEPESAWLKQQNAITVLLDSRRAPLNFVDANGRPAGLSVDILQWLSQHFGLTFTYKIAHSDEQMADLLMQYKSAIVASDLSVPGEGEVTPPTLKQSMPWLVSPAILLMKKADVRPISIHELSGEKIAIERGNPLIPWLETWFPMLQLTLTETSSQSVELLENGAVHGAISTLFAAQYYLKQNSHRGLYQALALPARPLNVSFAARGDNAPAIAIINKALQATSPETLIKLAASWRVEPVAEEDEQDWFSDLGSMMLPVLAVLLVIILSALWINHLRHSLQRLLDRLRQNRMLIAQLQAAKDKNQRMLQAHNTFMKSMSHQVRTPINAIIGLLELELRKPGNAARPNINLQTAYESACELMSLTGDVFDIFRAETPDHAGNSRLVNLSSLVQSTVALYRQQAEENSQRILITNRMRETQCETDPLLIIRVLSTLLRNAVKHTPAGDIEVMLLQGNINAQGQLPLEIKVTDRGAGLPVSWEKDLQLEESGSETDLHGTGLSLQACRQMVAMAGGKLRIESETGHGTAVSLHLNARSALKPATQVLTPTSLNILVVDDYPPALLILNQQLSAMGHKVTTAVHGLEGLNYWQNAGDYSLIITDCTMPEMDGFAMTQRIRTEERQLNLAPIPILGLTAMIGEEVTRLCLEAGMNECLTKPLSSNHLQRLITHYSAAGALHTPG